MNFNTQRIEFSGHSGATLGARLDLPNGPVRAYAIFVHCFTCSKDLAAARHIAAELAREGIAVLRFDFTGLGSSEGEFASTPPTLPTCFRLQTICADTSRHHHC